jgi:hypothetical protein
LKVFLWVVSIENVLRVDFVSDAFFDGIELFFRFRAGVIDDWFVWHVLSPGVLHFMRRV